MSANRLSWILVAVVVVVVGVLVFRTVQHDASTRNEPAPGRAQVATPKGSDVSPPARAQNPDSLRAAAKRDRQPNSVEHAQAVLKERGFYDGPITGNYNAEVAEAIKKFQKSVGMQPTGYLDTKTYTALGIQLHGKRR